MRRRFLLITTSKSGLEFARGLRYSGHRLIGIGRGYSRSQSPISAITASGPKVSFAEGVPTWEIDIDDKKELSRFFDEFDFDFAVASWPRLLSAGIIELANNRIVGTHPTPLPFGRGRHPLHWLRALGLRRSRLTAFWLDKGVDTGRKIWSIGFSISRFGNVRDDLRTVERKSLLLGIILGLILRLGVETRALPPKKLGTLWAKRGEADSVIDFRMSPKAIVCHVRAVAMPWPQATFFDSDGGEHRIFDARYAPLAGLRPSFRWETFGAILRRESSSPTRLRILVRCFGGAVWLVIQEPESIAKLFPTGTNGD